MAANKGTKIVIKKGAVVICSGIMSKELKYNGEPIDISSDDSEGWRELMADSSENSIDISFEGVSKDDVLRTIVVTQARLMADVTVQLEDLSTLTGSFYLDAFSEKGEYKDAIKFTADLKSSGEIVYAAPPSP